MTIKAEMTGHGATSEHAIVAGAVSKRLLGKRTKVVKVPVAYFTRPHAEQASPMEQLTGTRDALGLYLWLLAKSPAPQLKDPKPGDPWETGWVYCQLRTDTLAEVLGYCRGDVVTTADTHRVRRALAHLKTVGLLEVTPRSSPLVLRMVDPFSMPKDGRRENHQSPRSHFVLVPVDFFIKGWHAALSSTDIYMLLATMRIQSRSEYLERDLGDRAQAGGWISPDEADDRYGLSRETRGDAWSRLVATGLLIKRRQLVRGGEVLHRYRNRYIVNHERFGEHPPTSASKRAKVRP